MASSPDVASRHKARVKSSQESSNADSTNYPTGLNPFGDDTASDEYPDQLNPFSDDTEADDQSEVDEYDHSLNPFAGVDQHESEDKDEEPLDATNPFADAAPDSDDDCKDNDNCIDNENCINNGDADNNGDTSEDVEHPSELEDIGKSPLPSSAPSPRPRSTLNSLQISTSSLHSQENSTLSPSPTPSSAVNQSEANDASLTTSQSSVNDFRPVPLPRKKSSLKKTGTLNPHGTRATHSTSSLPRISTTTDGTESDTNHGLETVNKDQQSLERRSFQNKKRAAPPLPVNFKRQVDGCLNEIESEIENIGVQLLKIEQESLECRLKLQEKDKKKKKRFNLKKDSSDDEAAKTLSALFRQKSQLARRQKELMYKKREHILDLHYSDIEYQLRMITNKQAHLRTEEDDAKEQELLKRLVEIVEEKNDIVENQIKDSSMV